MKLIKIGELSKRVDIPVVTLRFYEKQGILSVNEKSESGYRYYSEEAVQQLLFVKETKELGFSLKEIKELMEMRFHEGSVCGDVKAQAKAKYSDVSEKIKKLERMKKHLEKIIESCEKNQEETCPLFEAFFKK